MELSNVLNLRAFVQKDVAMVGETSQRADGLYRKVAPGKWVKAEHETRHNDAQAHAKAAYERFHGGNSHQSRGYIKAGAESMRGLAPDHVVDRIHDHLRSAESAKDMNQVAHHTHNALLELNSAVANHKPKIVSGD